MPPDEIVAPVRRSAWWRRMSGRMDQTSNPFSSGSQAIAAPGIQLDAATPDSSQLFFLAGTAGKLAHDRFTEEEWDRKPIVTYVHEPGRVDVSLG